MKTASLALLCCLALPAAGRAADASSPTKPLTGAQCLSLLSAYRNLDGHLVILKQNGQDATVMLPWDFASGALRMKISTSITALASFETSLEQSRQAIVKEILAKMPDKDDKRPTVIPNGTPEFDAYLKQYSDALNAPCDIKLPRIKATELKLDKNEIPPTALSALDAVIDNDIQ